MARKLEHRPAGPGPDGSEFPGAQQYQHHRGVLVPGAVHHPQYRPPKSMNTIRTNRDGTPDNVLKLRSVRSNATVLSWAYISAIMGGSTRFVIRSGIAIRVTSREAAP